MIHRPLLSPAIAAAILAASLLAWLFTPPALLVGWLDEGGPVEDLTVVFYLLATLGALAAGAKLPGTSRSALALAVVMVSFAARELHLHSEYTGTSVLRFSYYFSHAPLLHRIVAFAAVGAVAASMALLAWRHGRSMVEGIQARSALAITAFTTVAILVVTKLVDRSLGLMRELFDLQASAGLRALQVAVEEPLELGLPLLVMVGLLQLAVGAARRQARWNFESAQWEDILRERTVKPE